MRTADPSAAVYDTYSILIDRICQKISGILGAHLFSFAKSLRLALLPGMIHIVVPLQQNLRNRHHRKSVVLEILQNGRQRLRRMERGVMKETNGAGLHLARHPFRDLSGREILPVQTVPYVIIFNRLKQKEYPCLRVLLFAIYAVLSQPNKSFSS